MIHDVDEAVRTLIREEALNGTPVEVVFDAPTKDWAARRNAPTLDVYLYDIREDLRRREVGRLDVHGDDGRVTERRKPPRHFKLSYLVTAWTQRPEDEHRLLSSTMACFLRHSRLPDRVLTGPLAEFPLPIPVSIALPPPEDRALSDVWSALGGELKPSLDLVVTVPFDTQWSEAAGAPVVEGLRVGFHAGAGSEDDVEETVEGAGGASGGDGSDTEDAAGPRGRGFASRSDAPPGEAPAGSPPTEADPGPGRAGRSKTTRTRRTRAPEIEETVRTGTPEQPGRTFHIRTIDEP